MTTHQTERKGEAIMLYLLDVLGRVENKRVAKRIMNKLDDLQMKMVWTSDVG